jgi:hypothetical protein
MKKLLIVILSISGFVACTDAGDGSEVIESGSSGKDTMVNVDGSSTRGDTSSYERSAAQPPTDSSR